MGLWFSSTDSLSHLSARKLCVFTGEKPFELPKGEGVSSRQIVHALQAPSAHSYIGSLPSELVAQISKYIPPTSPKILSSTTMTNHSFGSVRGYFDIKITLDLQIDEIEPVKAIKLRFGGKRERRIFRKREEFGEKVLTCGGSPIVRCRCVSNKPWADLWTVQCNVFREVNTYPTSYSYPSNVRVKVVYEAPYSWRLTCTREDRSYNDFINCVCFTSDSLLSLHGGTQIPACEVKPG